MATSRLKALDFQWINLAVVLSLRLFFADLLHHFSHMLPCTIWSCSRPQGQQESNIYVSTMQCAKDVGIFRYMHMSATEFELYTIWRFCFNIVHTKYIKIYDILIKVKVSSLPFCHITSNIIAAISSVFPVPFTKTSASMPDGFLLSLLDPPLTIPIRLSYSSFLRRSGKVRVTSGEDHHLKHSPGGASELDWWNYPKQLPHFPRPIKSEDKFIQNGWRSLNKRTHR